MKTLPRFPAVLGLAALVATGCTRQTIDPGEGLRSAPMNALPITPEAFLAEAPGMFVLIDLDINELSLMSGDEVVWSAPVGTGTGLYLRGEQQEWEFSTPRGVFEVKYKEEVPVWHLPDWYFIERELPIPPEGHPSRKLEGQLGVAAVYLGEEIAIHGTDRPELLGQRVSHGCIRLENRFAQRLYHNVQIGTPIVIVGGDNIAQEEPAEIPPRSGPRVTSPDPLAGVSSEELLRRLTAELRADDTAGDWVPLASRLITRGLRDDATALRGLLALGGSAPSDRLNLEYSTFLADTFSRGSWRVVVSLARIPEGARNRATQEIVDATMRLYAGSIADERAPWPTRRVLQNTLGPEGQAGWEALQEAERTYRSRRLPPST